MAYKVYSVNGIVHTERSVLSSKPVSENGNKSSVEGGREATSLGSALATSLGVGNQLVPHPREVASSPEPPLNGAETPSPSPSPSEGEGNPRANPARNSPTNRAKRKIEARNRREQMEFQEAQGCREAQIGKGPEGEHVRVKPEILAKVREREKEKSDWDSWVDEHPKWRRSEIP
jgi:hypothetical protein